MENENMTGLCCETQRREILPDETFNASGETTEADNGMCIGRIPTEAETAALKIRLMMKNAEGEDKCTLCKAAEALEKRPVSSGLDWAWPVLMMLMIMPFGSGGSASAEPFMRAYLDTLDKERKEKESGNVKE